MQAFANEFTVMAQQRLDAANFRTRSLVELNLPLIQVAETVDNKPVEFQVYGDPNSARIIVIEPLPYSVRLSDESQQVHLAAKQEVLGEEYCMVGVQPYDPKKARYSFKELIKISKGDSRPMAERILAVIGMLPIRDDQELILQGYSLAGDISIETANLLLTDKNRGIRRVDRLHVTEYARGKKYQHKLVGAITVAMAFNNSGGDLFSSIVAGDARALLEATGIDPMDSKAEKKHKSKVMWGVLAYAFSDMPATAAGFLGAATSTSFDQLNDMGASSSSPLIRALRMDRSLICLPPFTDSLTPHDKLKTFVEPGDHATGNDLIRETGFTLRAALS